MPVANIDIAIWRTPELFGKPSLEASSPSPAICAAPSKPRLMETAERPINAYRTDQNHQPLHGRLAARPAHASTSPLRSTARINSPAQSLTLSKATSTRLRKDFTGARQKFVAASTLAPDSPDPWIGLAWLDAYNDNNLQALISDQINEQKNHYTPAQREAAERGDVSMILGRKAMAASLNWRRKNSPEEETHFLREADDDFAAPKETTRAAATGSIPKPRSKKFTTNAPSYSNVWRTFST